MHLSTDNRLSELIHTRAGLLNEQVLTIPNRRFIPAGLVQTVTTGGNLEVMGCLMPKIQGSSIAFDYQQSLLGSVGEFVERYACAFCPENELIRGSWNGLSKSYAMLSPDRLRYYSDTQYRELEKKNVFPLGADDCIEWVRGNDMIGSQEILLPAFCVYMPYRSRIQSPHNYLVGATSTGVAAGPDLQTAICSGFCECAERHAFAQFWYCQDSIAYKQYTQGTVLNHFRSCKTVRQLYENPLVRIKTFDLSPFAPLETIVVVLHFRYKEKSFQSLGCAARFDKRSAIVKAAMEAYQGIEYAISLHEKHLLDGEMDFSKLTDFDTHFHFYNRFPEAREHSRILREAADSDLGDSEIFFSDDERHCRRFQAEEIAKTGLKNLIYKDITPIDIAEAGYRVARVVTPGWSLLTGHHAWPFLGGVFNGRDDLFLQWPHPFP